MLALSEFSVGDIKQAAGLTLILPRDGYEAAALVSHVPEPPTAVVLGARTPSPLWKWAGAPGGEAS